MDPHQKEVFELLESMGFPESEVGRAWNATDVKTVEGLINWLEQHPLGQEAENQGANSNQNSNSNANSNQNSNAAAFTQNIAGW